MDYQKAYDRLVQKNHVFSEGEYFETHHKVPKCLGGTDDANNLVNLTAREHYIAHLLLVKITEVRGNPQAHVKMLYAFNCMKWGRCKGKRSFKFNSRLYQKMKKRYSNFRRIVMKTSINPSKNKHWVYDTFNEVCYLMDKSIPLEDYQLPIRVHKYMKRKLDIANKEMERANRIERQKRLRQLQEAFFSAFYDEYLRVGFDKMKDKFNLNLERTAFLHLCKKRVPYYDRYKRLHIK